MAKDSVFPDLASIFPSKKKGKEIYMDRIDDLPYS